jgi:Tfp pilus assembly protein FimT
MKVNFVTSKSGARGFTLVEMVLLIMITSILAVVFAPQITDSINDIRLNKAAQKLAMDIRYMRDLAMSRHDVYGIEFDDADNSYRLYQWDGANKNTITDPHKGGDMIVDFDTIEAFNGVTLGASSTTDVTVDAFGVPYDANGLELASAATVTLHSGSLTATVQITNATGYVDVV